MKRIIQIMMLLAGLAASAQTGHLTFKGVPIDGTLNEFVGKLKQKGLTHLGTEQGVALLKGEFAAHKGCTIAVIAHSSGDVYRVGVALPEQDTWLRLYNDYSSLKEMLTQKYGEPSFVIEEFQSYGSGMHDDDDTKIYNVKFDRCQYITDFTTANGTIELRIDHNEMLDCYVILIYEDTSNGDKVRSSAIEDL